MLEARAKWHYSWICSPRNMHRSGVPVREPYTLSQKNEAAKNWHRVEQCCALSDSADVQGLHSRYILIETTRIPLTLVYFDALLSSIYVVCSIPFRYRTRNCFSRANNQAFPFPGALLRKRLWAKQAKCWFMCTHRRNQNRCAAAFLACEHTSGKNKPRNHFLLGCNHAFQALICC